MSVDDLADRLVRTGAPIDDIANQLGDDVASFPSLNPPTAERFAVGNSAYRVWSFCEHTDAPAGVAPEVLLHNGELLRLGIAIDEVAGADITYDMLLNGSSVGSVTLPSGGTSAVSVLTPTSFASGDTITVSSSSAPDAISPGRYGSVSVLFGPHPTLAP